MPQDFLCATPGRQPRPTSTLALPPAPTGATSCALAFALAVAALSGHDARAQAFPTRVVRVVVGFSAGGGTDVIARLIAQDLTRVWGHQVVVDNRPGASGVIGAEAVAHAAPDGHTMLVTPQTSIVMAPLLLKQVPYDPLKDFATVAVVASTPLLLVLHPSLPARDFKSFVALVKSRPDSLAFGSGGIGSTPHMAGELFNARLGVKVAHVPYKGEGPAMVDLLGGQIPYMFANYPVAATAVQDGKLRALAITSARRSALAPQLPTMAESGIADFEAATWNGLYLPAATPRDIVMRVDTDVIGVLAAPEMKTRMLKQGIEQSPNNTPEKHLAYVKAEMARWSKVIRDAGIKAE